MNETSTTRVHAGRAVDARRWARSDGRPRPVPVSMGSGETITAAAGGLLVTCVRFPAGLVLERHTHDQAVLAVMLDGSFDLAMRGRVRPCAPATVLTEPAGESHSNHVGASGATVLVLQPGTTREFPAACTRLFDSMMHLQDARVAALGRRVLSEIGVRDDVAALSIEGLALEMLALASRMESRPRAGTHPDWLNRVHELIHDRFLDRICIEDLARAVGLHPAHVARAFRQRYHTSVAAYVRGLRLDWASAQLLQSHDSLAAIAHRAGFADQSHFTRAFQRYAGVTPGEFRRCAQPRRDRE